MKDKMNDKIEYKRCFLQIGKHHCVGLALNELESFTIGVFHPEFAVNKEYGEDKIKGSFIINYKVSFDGNTIDPKLEVIGDGWKVLPEFSDLFESMSNLNNRKISYKSFSTLLLSLGIEDITRND